MAASATWTTPDLDITIEQMDARVTYLSERNDGRERFLLMYRTFKNELRRNLQAGRFADTRWSEAICCRMAGMYFEADTAYESDRSACPEPWLYAFDMALSGTQNLLQDMLLGMNAHINYDLAFCAWDTMRLFGDVPDTLPSVRKPDHSDMLFDALLRHRYSDFLLINQIAWESILTIQDVATRRFSRILDVAVRLERISPVQLSRLIATRVISDYRDRAWGFTMLLLMAEDEHQVGAVKRLASQFALDAAALVTRVDFRPGHAVQLLRRGQVLPDNSRRAEPAHAGSVIPFLASQLDVLPTRRIASRALIEYGPAVQPQLLLTFEIGGVSAAAQSQLLHIFAAHPTAMAATVLQRSISARRDAADDEPLRMLAELCAAGVAFELDEPRLRSALEHAAWHARWTSACCADLGVRFRGALLDETLRHRQVGHIRRMLYAGAILESDSRLLELAKSVSPSLDRASRLEIASAIDSIAPGVGDAVVRPLARRGEPGMPGDRRRSEERLSELCFHTDPWLRACALHRAGELVLEPALPVILPALDAQDPVVREAALYACANLMSPAELRATIEPRLAGITEHWLRDYAVRLLSGSRSEDAVYSTIEKVLLLKNAELFVDIPAEELAEIAGVVRYGAFRKGRRLIREGAPGDALYLLVRGEVDVVAPGGRHLARVAPFAVLGESSILLDEPCAADCIAATAGHALRIDRDDFQRLLLEYPDVTLGMLRVMTRRLKTANRESDPLISVVS